MNMGSPLVFKLTKEERMFLYPNTYWSIQKRVLEEIVLLLDIVSITNEERGCGGISILVVFMLLLQFILLFRGYEVARYQFFY